MTALLTQFTITEVSTGYWRVTFSNPPLNYADPDTITELQQLVGRIESDDTLQVVVLDSAHPDFFINRYDVSRVAETPVAPGPTGLPAFIDTTTRLTTSPVVTIASIRGRTRGGGPRLPWHVTCVSQAWSERSSGNPKWVREFSLAAAGSSASLFSSDGRGHWKLFLAVTTSTRRRRRSTAG